jgi:hypothetical protein
VRFGAMALEAGARLLAALRVAGDDHDSRHSGEHQLLCCGEPDAR